MLIKVALVVVPVTAIVVLFKMPPISWLPKASEAGTLLGTLLAAQAAIAALTLAVTIFVMQGVIVRPDVDVRMAREYVRRSWIQPIFSISLVAVAATGLVLLAESFGGAVPVVIDNAPGLRNLALVAAFAFSANLLLAWMLFRRAIAVSGPERWRAIRRHLNERDVREAVQVFLRRRQRAADALSAGEPDITAVFPDAREGSAGEAVTSLLDDARRAMDERRQGNFRESLDSIKELVDDAMDEIASAGMEWSAPGSQPQWPPLRELSSSMFPFREEVIRRGDRDQVLQVMGFDFWLMHTGWRRRCGEMFTVGLGGHRHNREIMRRIGSTELHASLRDQLWLLTSTIVSGATPEEAYVYIRQVLRHQERLLSDAMHADSVADYEKIHREYEAIFLGVKSRWFADSFPPDDRDDRAELYDRLEQDYRIALMGLGGRAVILADAGRIEKADPYLDFARGKYGSPRQLAEDVAQAIDRNRNAQLGGSQWFEWETEGADNFEVRTLRLERYPLTLFAVCLMELSNESMPALDLQGSAQQALSWFENNAARLENHVREVPALTVEKRREFATAALRAAVRGDEVAEDHMIIGRELSEDRVSTFVSEVYAGAFATNFIERLFDWAGASLYLTSDANGRPDERGFHRLEPKAAFSTMPDNAATYYAPLDGAELGRGLSKDVMQQFCEALSGAPQIGIPLDTVGALLSAIDKAVEDLRPSGELAVILAGDWLDVLLDINANEPDGYEPRWRIPEADRCGEIGRYGGHLIFRGPDYDERILYVVEPRRWGSFVRAQVEGDQDLVVNVNRISAERAQGILHSNPHHFASEPDEESKLRKLQTYVEIAVAARTAFRVAAPTRARRIVDVRQTD